jgi:hypothetical protein
MCRSGASWGCGGRRPPSECRNSLPDSGRCGRGTAQTSTRLPGARFRSCQISPRKAGVGFRGCEMKPPVPRCPVVQFGDPVPGTLGHVCATARSSTRLLGDLLCNRKIEHPTPGRPVVQRQDGHQAPGRPFVQPQAEGPGSPVSCCAASQSSTGVHGTRLDNGKMVSPAPRCSCAHLPDVAPGSPVLVCAVLR